jgi:hypothetical protein
MRTPPDRSLIRRAEHALASLQYQEKAALFHAAANALQLAMAEAETGDATKLQEWLESHNDLLDGSNAFALAGKVGVENLENKSFTAVSKEIHEVLLDQSFRIDLPMAANDAMKNTEESDVSPWHSMEQSAIGRLESKRSALKTSPIVATPPSSVEPSSDEPSSVETSSDEKYCVDTSILESRGDQDRPAWRKFAATHVWVSLLLHIIALPILGYIVVRQVVKEKKLAIVSAAVESDEVLTETALEMPSMMEATDLSPPASDPIEPTLPSDLSLPELDPVGTSPTATASSSKSLSQALKAGNGTPPSNKLVMGAEFFGVKATGNTFVYIVDCSPSMKKDGAFDAAKQEIGRSLMSMKPTQRFHLMFFGKEIESLTIEPGKEEEYPIYATPANVQKAVEWLSRSSIQKDGWPPNDSLNKAIDMQPDGIFMLFDGDTRSDVAKHLTKVNRTADILSEPGPKVPIHVIHFFQDEFAAAMRKVANENAGSYRFVARPDRNKSTKR